MKSIFKFSGLEFIYRKFVPLKTSNDFPSGIIWLIGLYVALFGIASTKYENKVDVLEGRTSSVMTLLSSDRRVAIEQLISLQNTVAPSQPSFVNPITTLKTMFGEGEKHKDTIDNIKAIIEALKSDLSKAKLDSIDLSFTNLSNGNLTGVSLRNSNLSNSDLSNSNLSNIDFHGATMDATILYGANLSNSIGLTKEMLSTALVDTTTIFPDISSLPTNIVPATIYSRLKSTNSEEPLSFIYKADRRFYVEISLFSDYGADETVIKIDGETVNSLYFDDSIYGGFIDLPYSNPGKLEISGEPILNEYYSNFNWDLGHITGGYHNIDWNYRDNFKGDKYQFITVNSEDEDDMSPLSEDYFSVKPYVTSTGPNGVFITIPRGKGKILGVQYKDSEMLEENLEDCMEKLMMLTYGDKDTYKKACQNGAYMILNVPDFRVDHIKEIYEFDEARFIWDGKVLGDSRS